MANQQNSYTGSDGSGSNNAFFDFTFPSFTTSEVKVEVDNVVKTLTTHYTVEEYNTTSGGKVKFTAGNIPTGTTPVRIFRQTDVDSPKATFTAGSSLKAGEINDNFKQVRHALQEAIGATYNNSGVVTSRQVQRYNIEADAIDGTLIADDVINSEHYAAGSIDLEHMSANSVDSDQYVDGSIDRVHLEADIIDGTKIEDKAVDSEHLADNAVGTLAIGPNSVTMAKLGSGALPTDITVASANIVDNTIQNIDINSTAGILGTKISPNFGSQNIATTGTVNGVSTTELAILDGATVSTTELNKLDGITSTTAELNILDGVTATAAEINKLDGVTSSTAELNILDGVTATASELNTLDGITASVSELNTLDGITSTTAELNILDGVTATTAELNLNDGQTATPAEVNILDGATLNTNELNKLDGVTASTAELNLLDGKSIVTSIASNATDTQLPSAQAVNERITTVVQDVGGFVPIANETSFPVNNPDLNDAAGTIVSIKALNSAFTTGSGVTTKTFSNGAGTGKNVTITGLTQATTYPAGRGLILETTQYSGGGRGGDANEYEYAFHRLTLDETGVADAQAAIDDFDERYYGPFSANQPTRPSGANRQNGDLYFNTSDGKMKVFNGSHASGTWDDVAAPGNFFINTISSSSGSGGGSATFNGTATRFTISNPPLTAQQLLVSVNGVVQKPNSGTSPSEGFAIDGADIIFAAAPANGAPYFIVTIGSSVNIGTPSDGTVTSAKIVDGTIVNGDISSSAAIAGSKISPDFGSQDITTTGDLTISGGDFILNGTYPNIRLIDTNNDSDYRVVNANGNFQIYDISNSATRFLINGNTGNIGIGTESPSDNLEIASTVPTLRLTDTDGGPCYHQIKGPGNGDLRISCDVGDSSSSASEIQFDVHDSTKMVIQSTGNVGIGTTSPAEELVVRADAPSIQLESSNASGRNYGFQASNDGKFHAYDGTAGVNRLTLDSSGKVGIGTTSPVGLLHLHQADSGTVDGLMITNTSTTNNGLTVGVNSTEQPFFWNGSNTDMLFATDNTERMRINSTGKVGIGITSPSTNLHVHTDSNGEGILIKSTGNTSNALTFDANRGAQGVIGVVYGRWNGTTVAQMNFVSGDDTTDKNDGYITFATESAASNGNVNATERMRINSTGRVGIGATDPQANLHLKVTGTDSPYQQFESANYNSFIGTAQSDDNLGTGSKAGNLVLRGQTGVAITGNNGTATQVKIDADGLKFGTDTAAANALDDYEEGTWTPVLDQGLSGVSYNAAAGHYTKIGNQVFAYAYILATATGNNSSGLRVGGLPFTNNNTTYNEGGGYVTYINGTFGTSGANMHAMPWVPQNSDKVFFHTPEDGNNLQGDETNFANKYLIFHVRYHT